MTPDERLERFADLAVRVGANVQPGQEVVLIYQVEHTHDRARDRARRLRAGARRVLPLIGDLHMRRAAIELGPEEELGDLAGLHPRLDAHLARDAPGAHPADRRPRAGPLRRARPGARRKGRAERRAGDLPPARDGAAHQLGDRVRAERGLGEGRVRRARRRAALGGDRDRRCASTRTTRSTAWREHAADAQGPRRSARRSGFDAIRFRGPGTDLVVGLLAGSRWMCATFETESGIEHLPNLPTEEVFTTPDWRRTEGTVQSTYPLIVPGIGARVEGFEVRFEEGGSWTSRRTATAPR